MKKLLLAILIGILLSSCATSRYGTAKYVEVPVDRVQIEYRDRVSVDTLYRTDSIIIREKGDTVYLEKYKYIYKVRELRDTINVTDTVTVVKTVEVIKEVNKVYHWQIVLMVLGGAAIAFGVYKLIKIIKV